jgi:hypothetical protein
MTNRDHSLFPLPNAQRLTTNPNDQRLTPNDSFPPRRNIQRQLPHLISRNMFLPIDLPISS